MLVADSLLGCVCDTTIEPGFRSDHALLVTDFEFEDFQRGRGFRKYNTSLLDNEAFVDKLHIVIEETITNVSSLEPDKAWEMIKYEIAQFFIKQSTKIARARKEKLNN